jgi:uncharacterized protein YecE (DUF72 family)
LENWAAPIAQWLREGRDVHVYFDNDARRFAPWNALTLMEMMGPARRAPDKSQFRSKRRPSVPPS